MCPAPSDSWLKEEFARTKKEFCRRFTSANNIKLEILDSKQYGQMVSAHGEPEHANSFAHSNRGTGKIYLNRKQICIRLNLNNQFLDQSEQSSQFRLLILHELMHSQHSEKEPNSEQWVHIHLMKEFDLDDKTNNVWSITAR